MFETGFSICVLVVVVVIAMFIGGNLFCKEWFDKTFVNGE